MCTVFLCVVWLGPVVRSPRRFKPCLARSCQYTRSPSFLFRTVSKRASQTTKFAAGSEQTKRRWRKRNNAPTPDLTDEMRKKHTTRWRTKSKSPAPHPAPFFSYVSPALGPGGCQDCTKKIKNKKLGGIISKKVFDYAAVYQDLNSWKVKNVRIK